MTFSFPALNVAVNETFCESGYEFSNSLLSTIFRLLQLVTCISGWELFDPFVPVEVSAFSQGELDVMIDFYVDKK
jgi:hypothetical protein